MIIVIHRVNSIRALKKIPPKYGVEVDVRGFGKKLVLNHEPLAGGDELEAYLRNFHHRFIIFNIKEAGIEERVIALAKKFGIRNYFLLDVEFPYLYRAAREGERRIAVRYSEDEPIEAALKYKGKVDWVWIDTQTRLPLNKKIVQQLRGFKTAIVSPERWGRSEDILPYFKKMKRLKFLPDLVMTGRMQFDIYNKYTI